MTEVRFRPTMRETLLDWADTLLDAFKTWPGETEVPQTDAAILRAADISHNWLAEARSEPRGFNVAQYDRLSVFLRRVWPNGLAWPPGVPMPPEDAVVPDTPRRRHRKLMAAGGLRGRRVAA